MTFAPEVPDAGHGPSPTRDTYGLLGVVLTLVAAAIGFLAAGAVIGRDLSPGTGLVLSLGAVGMLIIQALGGQRFRTGGFAVAWLFGVGLVIGLGLGPVLSHYASTDPDAISQAATATALVVAGMGVGGLSISKDLSKWIRPLTFAIFGILLLTLVLFLIGSGGSPLISIAIAGVSAALILVDFNYLRQHGTADDGVLLATGIFVSVVNIFLSLLNLFSRE